MGTVPFSTHYRFILAHVANYYSLCDMENIDVLIQDEIYLERLLISTNSDSRDLAGNIRAARAILNSFPDVYIVINAHYLELRHKNPEYIIDGRLGDRKGIMSEKGITAGFKSAKKQGCKIVVIDLDKHILQVRPFELSKYIARRKADFTSGMMEACYIVFNGNAVVVNARNSAYRLLIINCPETTRYNN